MPKRPSPNLASRLFHSPDHFTSFSSKQVLVSLFQKEPGKFLRAFSHSHPEYEFLLPLTPIPFLLYNGGTFPGVPGMVYPVQKNLDHGLPFPVQDVACVSILVDPFFLENALTPCPEYRDREFRREFTASARLNDLLILFRQEATSPGACDIVLQHLGELLCLELARGCFSDESGFSRLSSFSHEDCLRQSADFILAHLGEDVTVEQLAGMCHLSKYHYIRKFKEIFQEPPHQYLIKARLSQAISLVSISQLSISDISYRCGFASPTRFCEQFREKTGMTPGRYRKQNPVPAPGGPR